MQIKKYALAALACAAMSVPVLNQASVAADNSAEAGSFYFKLKGGYNRAAKRKISYSGVPGVVTGHMYAGNLAADTIFYDRPTTAGTQQTILHLAGSDDGVTKLMTASPYYRVGESMGAALDGTSLAADAPITLSLITSNEITDEEFDSMGGVLTSAAVGYNLSDALRAEAAYTYSTSNMKHRDTNNIAAELKSRHHELMIASYYDVKIGSGITPFVGAGFGYSAGTTSVSAFDNTAAGGEIKSIAKDARFKTDGGLVGKIEAGFQFPLCDGINLESSYTMKAAAISNPTNPDEKELDSTPEFLKKDGTTSTSGADMVISKGAIKAISHELSAGITVNF